MRNHTKIYFDYFRYDESDFIPSELSGERAVDINHIECKGMGGNPSKDKDVIENLIAMTREEHILYGDKTQYKPMLQAIHEHFMKTREPYFLPRDCKQLSKQVTDFLISQRTAPNMKTEKYFYYTVPMLKDKLATKMALRERLVNKVSKYDIEIREIEQKLIQRDVTN